MGGGGGLLGAAAFPLTIGATALGFGGDYLQGRYAEKGAHEASDQAQLAAQKAREDITTGYGAAVKQYLPWLTTGKTAQNIIADLSGANGPEAQAKAYENFKTDPSYKFQVDQANQALGRSALARGNIFSGNFAAASDELNQNLASQGYSNYYNRLLGLSNTGYNAAGSRANLFSQMGTNLGNVDIGVGTQLANSAIAANQARGQMYGNMFDTLSSGAGMLAGMGGGSGVPGGSVIPPAPGSSYRG